MNTLIIFLLCFLFFSIIIGFVLFIIITGVGFNNLFAISKAKRNIKKGFLLVRMFKQTGIPELISLKVDDNIITPFKDKKESYIFKKDCIYNNEYNIPTIDYNQEDADPINRHTNLINVTSPRVITNIIAKGVKAESTISGKFEWFEKNWFKLMIGVLIFVGLFVFVIIHMSDLLAQATLTASQYAVIPAPTN